MDRESILEEIANSVTHAAGMALSIAGLSILVALACIYGNISHVVSCTIFGTSLVLLYTASTAYHIFRNVFNAPRLKRTLKTIDHACIYILIAGTYTPFMLVNFRGILGWALFGVVWAMAVFGIFFKIFYVYRFKILSTLVYVMMGWCILITGKTLLSNIAFGGLILLLAGGLAYTGGVVFYLWNKIPYHHAIWHLFVLAGSTFHYFAVIFYVLPL
jgi:hemolysin III